MTNIGAFFDVDGTIFRNSLLIEHFKLLIKNELLSMNAWTVKVKESFDKWSSRYGDYDIYLEDLVDNYMKGIENISIENINKIADKVIEIHGDKLYRYTRNRIEFHKKQGHKLIIISGSPTFLVEKMAKKLGFDDYMASEYCEINGYYVGTKTPMWDSVSKENAINFFVNKYNIDLSKSYAYGDTNGDYSMLSLVGNPFAINPAKRLLDRIQDNVILSEKITYIVERKDVIYNFNSKNISYNKEELNDTN